MSTAKIKEKSLARSTSVVSSATAFSRVLGLIREQVMAYFFGASMATDAFIMAFRVPNLLRDMFAEGALSAAFIPVFKERLVNRSEKEAFSLASILFTLIFLVVGLIVLLGIIAAPAIIFITANGFTENPEKFDLTVSLTRIMMVYLLLVSLSALVMGMLNSFGKFAIPALSAAMFNLGMVITVTIFLGFFQKPVYALAVGVLVGGVGQLAIQLPLLWKIGFRFKPIINIWDEGLRKVLKLVTPMIIGLSAGRINILISTFIASFLIEGSISYLNYSYRLMHFPMGVFAVALGTVTLPKVSEMAAKNDLRGLSRMFHEALSLNLFMLIPSAIFLAFYGNEIVEMIFQWGSFSKTDSEKTYMALLHYSYGLIGFATVRVIVPFYYAFKDSKTPMKISIIAVAVNILLYWPLTKLLNFAGLAAATSIGGLVNMALLVHYLPSKGIKIESSRVWLNTFRIVIAALLSCYIGKLVPFQFISQNLIVERIILFLVPVAVSVVSFLIFCYLFRVKEVNRIKNIFKRN